MNEKTMVSDALVGVNGELKMFGDMIPQTENKELKTMPETDPQRMRDVSGEALSGSKRKKLLCTCSKGIRAGSRTRKINLNTA